MTPEQAMDVVKNYGVVKDAAQSEGGDLVITVEFICEPGITTQFSWEKGTLEETGIDAFKNICDTMRKAKEGLNMRPYNGI